MGLTESSVFENSPPHPFNRKSSAELGAGGDVFMELNMAAPHLIVDTRIPSFIPNSQAPLGAKNMVITSSKSVTTGDTKKLEYEYCGLICDWLEKLNDSGTRTQVGVI